MTRWYLSSLGAACAVLALAGVATAQEPAGDVDVKIADAISAAPSQISDGATIVDWDGTVLREGSNAWTCMPTPPGMAEGNAPMCLDAMWLNWAQAWQSKTEPEISRVGVGYMLGGDTGASNSDPWATDPDAVEDWVVANQHLMVIVPDVAALEGIPTDPSAGAWVMWAGTPYAHVMIPIGEIEAE